MSKEKLLCEIQKIFLLDSNLRSEIEQISSILKTNIPTENLFRKFEPKQEWFHRQTPSIHGIGHETRVLLIAELLGRILKISHGDIDQNAIRWAAITHDTQRFSDSIDKDHGKRSALWVLRNCAHIEKEVNVKKIAYINHWHVPSDKLAPEMTIELKIFKDADALDRWRIHDLDVNYLRTEPAKLMTNISKHLCFASQQFFEYFDEFSAVIETGKLLNIIIPDG